MAAEPTISLAWLKAERRRQIAALKKLPAPATLPEVAQLAAVQAAIAAFEAEKET